MQRLLAIVLTLLLGPSLALATKASVRCQDGVVRSQCCCPKVARDGEEAPPCAAFARPGCCEVAQSASLLAQKVEIKERRDRLPSSAFIDVAVAPLSANPCDSLRFAAHGVKPPAEQPLYIKHSAWLI